MRRAPLVGEDYEEMGEHRSGRHRTALTVCGVVLVVAVLGGVLGVGYLRSQIHPSGKPGAEVAVTIPNGASMSAIANVLADKKVIDNATVFKEYVRVKHVTGFQAGDYTLRLHQPYDQVIAALAKGAKVDMDRVTIPEGFTLAQIAARVGSLPGRSAERFLQLANSGDIRSTLEPAGSKNLEGLLFPDTYFVTAADDEAVILRRMVQAFDEHVAALGVSDAAARLGVTPYQVVIVASMVEREAKVDEDRGPVASVIYNRLHRGMPLGIDATLLYALNGDVAKLGRNPHLASPYNTRDTKGLPPTPIASPGRPSLQAAVSPATTPFLYYVLADKSGKHAFATTLAEHDRQVAQARAKGLL